VEVKDGRDVDLIPGSRFAANGDLENPYPILGGYKKLGV
jgi:hypothetical protein